MADATFQTLLLGDTTLDFVKKINSSFIATQEGLNGLEESSVKSISVEVDDDYVLTISLLDGDGNTISEKDVDLPLETMVVGASYANGKITLTLQNGNTTEVDVSALVRGLVPDTRTINDKPLNANITLTQDDIKEGSTYKRYSTDEKTKLDGIQEGAEQNQNTFSNVKVGTSTIAADTTTDTLELVAGANVSLGVDGKKVTISSTGGGSNTGGKVQDVRVNGTSVLDANGIARITIEQLKSSRVYVSSSEWTTYTMADGTTYYAIQVEETDLALGVFVGGNEIVVQKVYADDSLYLCSSTAVDCEIRTINGGLSSGGGSGLYHHSLTLTSIGFGYAYLNIISTNPYSYSWIDFSEFLRTKGFAFPASGYCFDNEYQMPVINVGYATSTGLVFTVLLPTGVTGVKSTDGASVYDIVTPI